MTTLSVPVRSTRALLLALAALLLGVFLAVASPAQPAAASCGGTTTVGNQTQLNAAIATFNAVASGPCVFTIQLSGDIPLTASTTAINNSTSSVSLVIQGSGFTVDGQGTAGVQPFNIFPNTTVTMNDLTVTGGNVGVGAEGGGLYNEGTLTIRNSTISGNISSSLHGGGLSNYGTMTIDGSTISGNSASGEGGGIINHTAGTLTIHNSTLSGNSAGVGGGVHSFGTLTIDSATFTGNTATSGGGALHKAGSSVATVKNTILANSTAPGGDCVTGGGTINAEYSLIESGLTCVNGTSSNNLTGDPSLAALLANNGGPTQTHALLAGSPAIDAGDTTLTTDQRGQLRPQGAADDIGAFETSASLRFTIEAPTVQTSQVSCPAPGVSLQEDFDSLSGSGVNQVTGGALGDYVASGSFLTVFGQDAFGGAEQPNNPTKKYLELETSGGTGWYTLDLTATGGPGPVGYFGFWWSAGDGNNVLEVTRVDGSVETFTTQSIINSPALQGSPGCPDAGTATCHFGNPTAAFQGQNAAEAYSFVNIYAQDEASKIVSVRFETTGSGFESDNHTICTEVIAPNNQGGADLGGIVIKKVTNPVGGTGFGFTQTIDGTGPFTLDDGDEQPFTSVQPGSYTVVEDAPTGSYVLTDITCVDGDTGGTASAWDVASRTATINVDLNETVTCTFYNVDSSLAVTLASFDAAAQADHALVTWETVSEMDNAGFDLYRTGTADPPTAADLLAYVPSQGPGSTQGFAYSYPDYAVTAGEAYWYWLEDVDFNGVTTMHGPVSVAFGSPTAVTLSGLEAAADRPAHVWPWLLAVMAAALALAVASRRRSRA